MHLPKETCHIICQVDDRRFRFKDTFQGTPHIRVIDLIDINTAIIFVDKESVFFLNIFRVKLDAVTILKQNGLSRFNTTLHNPLL